MLVSCGGPDVRELPVTPNQHEALKKQAQTVRLDAILGGLEVLTATKTRMRGSTHTQVLLEMAVVRLSRLGELRSINELVQLAQALATSGVALPVTAANVSTPAAPRLAATPAAPATAPSTEGGKKNDLMAVSRTEDGYPTAQLSTDALTKSTLRDVWGRFLRYTGEKYPILAKHLSFSSSYAIFGPNSLAIKFPPAYSEARANCESEANAQRIQEALKRVTGQTVTVRFEVDASALAQPVANGPPVVPVADRKRALSALPLFKKAGEALGAQIWHMDDDFNPAAPPRPASQPNKDQNPETDTDEG
jgi:DNA polymerase-3 subunit gamma/tau